MKRILPNIINRQIALLFLVIIAFFALPAQASATENAEESLDVKGIIFDHLGDAYEWHIITWGEKHISLPLPIIVRSNDGSWHTFLSSAFHKSGDGVVDGLYIAQEGDYAGKIVEKNASGDEVRPIDLSITKNVLAIFISCILLCVIVLSVSRWSKRNPNKAPKGFIGVMEMFIMDINDNVVKANIGKGYEKFSPYLLTAFFFIFLNNLMGLIPIFPGGANVTGNIAVTLSLALCTFLITNIFGNKEYWKEIFWPDVPGFVKPIMIPIELIGMITKPFALMIRLFANIMAGHSIILSLICIIFITSKIGLVINGSMTLVSVLFTLFMNFLELLVAYIQAYVFTILSAVFIGLSTAEHHKKTDVVKVKK